MILLIKIEPISHKNLLTPQIFRGAFIYYLDYLRHLNLKIHKRHKNVNIKIFCFVNLVYSLCSLWHCKRSYYQIFLRMLTTWMELRRRSTLITPSKRSATRGVRWAYLLENSGVQRIMVGCKKYGIFAKKCSFIFLKPFIFWRFP